MDYLSVSSLDSIANPVSSSSAGSTDYADGSLFYSSQA